MFLLHNLILLFQKILNQIQHTVLLWKFQENRTSIKLHFNHSSGIEFQDFMHLYKKSMAKPYSFLVIDATLPSDNSSCFRMNLLEPI